MELDLRSSRGFDGCFPLDHSVAAHDDSFRLNFNGTMPAFPACRPWACIPEDGALILRCRGHSSQLDTGDFRLGVEKWIGREGFAPTRERECKSRRRGMAKRIQSLPLIAAMLSQSSQELWKARGRKAESQPPPILSAMGGAGRHHHACSRLPDRYADSAVGKSGSRPTWSL